MNNCIYNASGISLSNRVAILTKSCTLNQLIVKESPVDDGQKLCCDKPYVISVCGLTSDENKSIFNKLNDQKDTHSLVEFNLSCPNLSGKSQICYDYSSIEYLLDMVYCLDIQQLNL